MHAALSGKLSSDAPASAVNVAADGAPAAPAAPDMATATITATASSQTFNAVASPLLPGAASSHLPAARHAAAHGADITAQLFNALPADMAKADSRLLHVLLTPETLGNITVKIEHDPAGNANVTITASQPETLASLKKDADTLNQILTNAGVTEASRQVEFRLAPVAATPSGSGLGDAANALMQGNTGQNNTGQGNMGGQAQQNGTGFASSSQAGVSAGSAAASAMPAQIASPANRTAASSSLNMIA